MFVNVKNWIKLSASLMFDILILKRMSRIKPPLERIAISGWNTLGQARNWWLHLIPKFVFLYGKNNIRKFTFIEFFSSNIRINDGIFHVAIHTGNTRHNIAHEWVPPANTTL
jgi:hypothetical protein